MGNSFLNCEVRIIRQPNLDALLLTRRSQKIICRRKTYAVDQSFVNQPLQRRKKFSTKNTPFGRRNSMHVAVDQNHWVNNFKRNDTCSVLAPIDDNVGNSIDASSSNANVGQLSCDTECDESHSPNVNGETLATNGNVDDDDSMGTPGASNDNDGDDITSVNGTSNREREVQLVSFDSDNELDHSMVTIDIDNAASSIPVLCYSAQRKTTKTVPSLIPIRDSPLIRNVHQPAKNPTRTAKYISKFLRDLDGGKHHTVLPKAINMNQNAICSDVDFGRLQYSDSE